MQNAFMEEEITVYKKEKFKSLSHLKLPEDKQPYSPCYVKIENVVSRFKIANVRYNFIV